MEKKESIEKANPKGVFKKKNKDFKEGIEVNTLREKWKRFWKNFPKWGV